MIAGQVDLAGLLSPADRAERLRRGLEAFGPAGTIGVRELGAATFGRSLQTFLPEDQFDRQSLVAPLGDALLVADCRIDHWSELRETLGIDPAAGREWSDADLLMQCWDRWRLALFDHVLGDIALAVWDPGREELILARSPLAQNSLFHCRSSGGFAFASLPQLLFDIAAVERRPNLKAIARLAAGREQEDETLFEGVMAVGQGQAVCLKASGIQKIQLWNPPAEARSISRDDAGDQMRELLDRSVASCLRRASGPVATQLSAGRDSGAVATSAAVQLRASGDQLVAYTAAPARPVEAGQGWFADESPIAAQVAAMHGMHHVVCRPSGSIIDRLDAIHRVHWRPMANLMNLDWALMMGDDARRRGSRVMLTGGVGNFGLSLGGDAFLPDLLAEKRWFAWWSSAKGVAGRNPSGWLTVANLSFGRHLPNPLYRLVLGAAGRTGGGPVPPLSPQLKQQVAAIMSEREGAPEAPSRGRERYRRKLVEVETGGKIAACLWNTDWRDPTADRRLIEHCLNLPADMLIAPDGSRPAFTRAFHDRLPSSVIEGKERGFQSADWLTKFDPAQLAAAFRRYSTSPLVSEVIDIDAALDLCGRWPSGNGHVTETIDLFGNQLIDTLSLASFLFVNFPERQATGSISDSPSISDSNAATSLRH